LDELLLFGFQIIHIQEDIAQGSLDWVLARHFGTLLLNVNDKFWLAGVRGWDDNVKVMRLS